MISCEDAAFLISIQLDGEQSPDQDSQLGEHLDDCPLCRAHRERERERATLLSSTLAPAPGVVGILESQVRARLASDRHSFTSSRLFLPLSLAAGFLFGVLGWMVTGSGLLDPAPQDPGAAVARPSTPVDPGASIPVLVQEETREEFPLPVDGDPGMRLETRTDRMDVRDTLGDEEVRFQLELERLQRQLIRPASGNPPVRPGNWY